MYRSMTIIIGGLFFLQIAPASKTINKTTQSVRALRPAHEPECRGKEVGKFVKDPYACDKFYYCGPNETAVVVDCPHGMIFNDEKEICDIPSNYLCIPRIKEGEEYISSTSKRPQTTAFTQKETSSKKPTVSTAVITPATIMITTTTTTAVTTTTNLVVNEKKCPSKDTEKLIFLPHPRECQRYYICYHGVPVVQECISELHWSPKNNRCDFPEKAGCLVPTVVAPTAVVPIEGVIINCPFRGEQIFPHPVHCNYFIYCINGYATVQQCPFYHYFDFRMRRCLWQTIATCIVRKK